MRLNFALALEKSGRAGDAIAETREALRRDVANLRARTSLARRLLDAQAQDDARRIVEETPLAGPLPTVDELDRFCAVAFRAGTPEPCRALARRGLEENEGEFGDVAKRAGADSTRK